MHRSFDLIVVLIVAIYVFEGNRVIVNKSTGEVYLGK